MLFRESVVSAYFFDTSALVKLYLEEEGSAWVREIADPERGNTIHIAHITGPETIAAFFRKVRTQEISNSQALQAASDFKEEFVSRFEIVEIKQDIIDLAMTLAQRHGLRGYDSVQLAAAVSVFAQSVDGDDPPEFVSADSRLNEAAAAEGMAAREPADAA